MKQDFTKTSRRAPVNWRDLHAATCDGNCLDRDSSECPVFQMNQDWVWRGNPRLPMDIQWTDGERNFGTFYDRSGQICQVCLAPNELNLGVRWALYAPDARPPWTDEMYDNRDTLSFSDPKAAYPALLGLRYFQQNGTVPANTWTSRGFGVMKFEDSLGQQCSLQDSSLASEAACWFGVDTNCAGDQVSMRMHLTLDMVDALVPLFELFVFQPGSKVTVDAQAPLSELFVSQPAQGGDHRGVEGVVVSWHDSQGLRFNVSLNGEVGSYAPTDLELV